MVELSCCPQVAKRGSRFEPWFPTRPAKLEEETDLKKFAKTLNDKFGLPFLPPGFVDARVTGRGTLWFRIGHRDVELDEELEPVGSGTDMQPEDRWLIQKGEKGGVKKN